MTPVLIWIGIVYGVMVLLSFIYFILLWIIKRNDPDNILENDPEVLWIKNYANKKEKLP
jgi:hypothetical protein